MTNTSKKIVDAAVAWYQAARIGTQLENDRFVSAHLDNFGAVPNSARDTVKLALEVYAEVLKHHHTFADDLMLTLTIVTEDVKVVGSANYQAVLAGELELREPPELYITRRLPQIEPDVVEEYKIPIVQNEVTAPSGVIYCYYRCHRNDPDDWYGSGFYYEHYPNGQVPDAWY